MVRGTAGQGFGRQRERSGFGLTGHQEGEEQCALQQADRPAACHEVEGPLPLRVRRGEGVHLAKDTGRGQHGERTARENGDEPGRQHHRGPAVEEELIPELQGACASHPPGDQDGAAEQTRAETGETSRGGEDGTDGDGETRRRQACGVVEENSGDREERNTGKSEPRSGLTGVGRYHVEAVGRCERDHRPRAGALPAESPRSQHRCREPEQQTRGFHCSSPRPLRGPALAGPRM
ncbi:hypothetical protein STTU_2704 [Streptomyces sp. Tu6071]|nr:hypothetical protein STTU_2704 [Streptomyces sp. Tu6071]